MTDKWDQWDWEEDGVMNDRPITPTQGAPHMNTRPAIVEDQHLEYLDRLCKSGVTNMFGAGAYLERTFSLSRGMAATVLGYWMKSFGKADR